MVGYMIYIAHYILMIISIGCASTENSSHSTLAPDSDATPIQTWTKRADQYSLDGLYREASEEYRKILEKDADNFHALKMLGIIHVKTGEYKKAIKVLSQVVGKLSLDFEANYYLAEALRTQDRFEDAIFRYNIALSVNPDHILSLKALAWSYYQIRYYKAAMKISNRLTNLKPKDVQVSIISARILNKVGEHRKALRKVSLAIASAPKAQVPYLESVLGDIYLSIGSVKNATTAYQSALKEQPLLAGALLGLGKINLQLGSKKQKQLAVTYLKRASRIKPALLETYYHLGLAQVESDPEASRRYLAKFTKSASGDPEYKDQVKNARLVLSASYTEAAAKKAASKTDRL